MTRAPDLLQESSVGGREHPEDSAEALRAEIAVLRRRLVELEGRLSEREGGVDEVSRHERAVPYREIFEKLPIPTIAYGADGVLFAINKANRELIRVTREALVGRYNIRQDREAIAKGYAAEFERTLGGEVVTMPPTSYDTASAGLDRLGDRIVWSRTTHFPVEDEEGCRYVVEVNLDITEQHRAEQALREREELLQAIIDNAPMFIHAKDLEGRYTLANRRLREIFGKSVQAMMGKTDRELFSGPVADRSEETDRHVLAAREPLHTEEHLETAEGLREMLSVKFPLFNTQGDLCGLCAISSDVTERRRAEEENRKLQEEMLRLQAAALRALSTPLIPIARGVLVMPLIGDVDRDRAQQVLQTLLQGVTAHQARVAILDVTGVPSAGPEVADGLVRAAKAVSLLGARVVLTGIQSGMAQMLSTLDANLEGIVTRGTLESGIAYAMKALRGR